MSDQGDLSVVLFGDVLELLTREAHDAREAKSLGLSDHIYLIRLHLRRPRSDFCQFIADNNIFLLMIAHDEKIPSGSRISKHPPVRSYLIGPSL